MKNGKPTKEYVLEVIIKNYPFISNWKIATANPKCPLTGLQRLRQLSKEGIVNYTFEKNLNEYWIKTGLYQLRNSLKSIQDKRGK